MSKSTMRPLAEGYTAEIDLASESEWNELIPQFEDANLYQTWPYADVVAGPRNVSRLVLKRDGRIVAIAQARIKKLPLRSFGVAYVFWGPLWQRKGEAATTETFRQAVRALRNHLVLKRGLNLRFFPHIFASDPSNLLPILVEEGFALRQNERPGRTVLMDMSLSLDDLRGRLSAHWKRQLKTAERNNLQYVEGTEEELFSDFVGIYRELLSRKKFSEPNNIYDFCEIQKRLPEEQKMRILLCRSNEDLCAGAIYSQLGNGAIYLFGATSDAGIKSRGSYLLHWKIVEALKRDGTATLYNLNGANPVTNPGTYRFKMGLAGEHGQDVFYAGKYETYAGQIGRAVVRMADAAKSLVK